MAERKERRKLVRVALSGTPIVHTHDGVEAQLLNLSLHGACVAHVGILRPGSLCYIHLPPDLGSLHLAAQVLWCTILGAEWRADGERHLQSQSGLRFTKLTEPQRTVLAGVLERANPEDRLLREGRVASA
jgi:hypothetical protein